MCECVCVGGSFGGGGIQKGHLQVFHLNDSHSLSPTTLGVSHAQKYQLDHLHLDSIHYILEGNLQGNIFCTFSMATWQSASSKMIFQRSERKKFYNRVTDQVWLGNSSLNTCTTSDLFN